MTLEDSLDTVEWEISNVKKQIESYSNAAEYSFTDDEWNEISVSYDDEIAALNDDLDRLNNNASNLRKSLDDKQSKKDAAVSERGSVQNKIQWFNGNVGEILTTVSKIVDSENTQLSDIYSEIAWLFANNIMWTMEYIIYLEWWNPEDYYEWPVPETAPRVPFLPEWTKDINGISRLIQVNVNSLKTQYKKAYTLILEQQKLWKDLAWYLRSESVRWSGEGDVSKKIDEISEKMDNIFTIWSRDEDEDHVKCYTEDEQVRECTAKELEELENNNIQHLKENTADEQVASFLEGLQDADLMFKNITKVDTGWVAIIQAAISDVDFRLWASKKSIDIMWMSWADLINQYARWAQTDWENTTWAKMNRELLAWASIHMSGMNLMTADRPIDSPRYVSMQSVGWNDIKLIYPDLFKVEVFVLTWKNKSGYDIHELLTWWQIKENLVKYLSWKVDEYNKILESEYKKANATYGSKTVYYDKLKTLWFNLATPDMAVRPYNYFTYEDFENALWWSWVLDAISEMLYYQSLTNKKKLSTWVVAEDIELIKKSFSLNDKREWVLKDYLTEWNDEIKNPLLVIPTYELSWYEVAYVNSDWKDYIIPTEEDIDIKMANTKRNAPKIKRHQTVPPIEDTECNIPVNWKLPLFKLDWWEVKSPWYEGVKCWWRRTLEQPYKLEVTFDRAFGEVIVWSWFAEFMKSIWKSYISETKEELTTWWDQMSKYADARESLLTPGTWYDADKDITQMQVEAEKHNAEANAWWSNISTIYNNVKISNSNVKISDSNPSSLLKIESIVDVGNIKVEFMWTWDWCIIVDGSTLCNGATTTRSFNPKTKPFSGLVTASCKAWKNALSIKVYWWGWYFEKVLKYTVSPGQIDKFEIKFYDEKTVAWMVSPVEVIWYDKCDNRVDRWLEKYDITASQWEFLKNWGYMPEISTNDFRKLKFYYKAPLYLEWDKALITISKHNNNGSWGAVQVVPKNPYEQPLVDGAPTVWLDWKKILEWKKNLVANEEYRLLTDESIYDDWWNLKKWKLKKLYIEIRDWGKLIDVDSQILVTSQNWLVYVWQIQKDEDWKEVFFETSKNYISWGKATIYYYPTTVAWEEKINIDIPWLETRVINLSIKPNELVADIQTVLEKDVLDLNDTMYFELFLSDKWWNLIDHDEVVWIFYDEDKIEFVQPSGWEDWYIEVAVKNWYDKYLILWTWAWLAYIQAWSEPTYFNVDKHIFPDSGLNIMYLNYFWNDRWNQWWYLSDNNKYVEGVMTRSNKIITTTTQLVSEDKIKKMIWKLEPWFKIWDPDKVGTLLNLRWSVMNMIVWEITSMQAKFSSFSWVQADQDVKEWSNYIQFIPSDPKYSIDKAWMLYNSWERVVDLVGGEVTLQLSTTFTSIWDNIWKLIYKWINYWDIIIHYPSFSPSVKNFTIPWERYVVDSAFTNWSTYSLTSVGIFDLMSNFELNTNYKSIQNSDELDEKIWFLWDFKNITLFAEWEIVWEATRKFWSEFVINLWDPVLSRKSLNENVYGTEYDGWIWQEIYADPENNIFGTYQIDFNWDGTKDLLVVSLDWSVRLSKNYWGTPDLRNMQELMRIAVPIKEVFVWDADGKWGEDIIVLTTNNQLRAYLNNGWVFDVDGSVACLNQNVFWWEISSTPSNLEELYQIFVEDMNRDSKVDIITYDKKWYIKVFYWWSTKNWPNYLSTDKYACDTWWIDRERNNITVVDALWITIDGSKVFDNSMLHWVWMEKPTIEINADELEEYWIHFDPNKLESMITERDNKKDWSIDKVTRELMDVNDPQKPNYKFDLSEASEKFIDEWAKFVDVTLYENDLFGWWDWNNYVFAPSSYLDPECAEDIGSVWKNYRIKDWWTILQDWDLVTVTVTVKASDWASFQWAFWDIIQWPWNLYYDENKILKSIRFVHNKRNAVIKQRDWNFAYIIDKITLWPWETMVFEYDLEYRSIPVRKMDITYETFYSDDELPDIKLQSVDWCAKDFDAYINWWRSFWRQTILLQDMIEDTYKEEDEKTEDFTQDVIDAWSDVNKLPGIVWDKIDRLSLLKDAALEIVNDENGKKKLESAILQKIEEEWLAWLNMNLNVDLSSFEGQTNAIEDVIDEITRWMCNWFQFGWTSNCPWLPVPFNQGFLAPWKYHLFGCWDLPLWKLENWIPVFFFPGTLKTPYGSIPIPWWLKWWDDEFLWVSGWDYPSFIRIYAVPTLTAQLWIAICLWPSSVSKALKSPWSDIGWNCIVFAIKPQCKNDSAPTNLESPYESYSEIVEEVRDSGVCLESQKWPQVTKKWYNPSPLHWYSFNSNYRLSAADYDVDYNLTIDLWILSLEREAYIASDDDTETRNSIEIWNVEILWGTYTVNKIKWWLQQWLRKILIDKWLDPQIRYILNQLTKMHVEIIWPDLSSLMWEDLRTINNVAGNFGDATVIGSLSDYAWFIGEEKNNLNKIWDNLWGVFDEYAQKASTYKWYGISTKSVDEFNNKIWNPFEALANLMNESNIINISIEPLTVKVPMIFSEDLNEYEFYLHQWLEENQAIMDEWEGMLNALSNSCSKKPANEQAACKAKANEYLTSFIDFRQSDWPKMVNKIYTNLMILQEYRNFPFEIYEWIHVIDRYMSEISSLINNTIWYLSHWMVINAERFVWYIDAITLMLNIIKTYQLIIDFSVDWSKRCGNCAKDTYDQYSCKLSFLCDSIQLPIIQIPNFKLPDITLDFSSIDLWLDIILPEFNFLPVKVALPDLPNLPEPPSIWANIRLFNLPDIPILPEPPTLPELPSFIPEVEIELPVLPPAPELPELPSRIEGLIKVADFIWQIYCIVKKKFWLVWEKSVKAKIEQITQRTYEVDWIDNIMNFTNRSFAPLKTYGVDYEVSSYVDLQFTMRDFYDYMDMLTKWINNLSEYVVKQSDDWVSEVSDNPIVDLRDSVDGINIKLWMAAQSWVDLWLTSDEIKYVDYDRAKDRLNEVLAYFKGEVNGTTLNSSIGSDINKIENQINKPSVVEWNIEWIDEMKGEIMDLLDNEKWYYDGLADMINKDYDWFLAMVDSKSKWWVDGVEDSEKLLTFNVQLFNLDPSTKETVKSISKTNPYLNLIENKKEIIEWYWDAINNNTSDSLWLTEREYLVLRNNIWSMKKQVATLYSVATPASSTQLIAKDGNWSVDRSLVASDWLRIWSNMKVAKVIDPSVFSNWVYEKMTEWEEAWKLTKVVNSDSFVEKIWDKFYDTNPFWTHDIILWDENSIYKKCASQACNWDRHHFGWYYSKHISEIPYEETWVSFGADTKLKIADWDVEVKNWKVVWQTFDILSFSWDLSDSADAYLIKLVERIDYSYEKADYNGNKRVSYVLALPNWVELSDLYKNNVKLELINDKSDKKIKTIESLYWNSLVQVVYYDTQKKQANIVISNVDRKWYYWRISTLDLDGQKGIYYINSPWSNQVVAWKQAVWDDKPPLAEQELFRPSTAQVVSVWDNLEWYVWTNYILNITWRDNVALSYINVSQNWEIIDEKYTSKMEDTLSAPVKMHFYNEIEMFDLLWIDQFWNKTEKTVSVVFNIPTIKVTDVARDSDWETVTITAELSQDLDEWTVSFQRRRGTIWKTIKKKYTDEANLAIWPLQKIIRWTWYSAGNDIAMYDKNDAVIALLNPDTSEIKIQSGYLNTYDVKVKVENSAVLYLYDKSSKINKFSVSIPTDSCVKIEAADVFKVVDLPENWNMWMFNWWKVVHKDWTNILIASPTCHLYSEFGLEWTYSYDRESDAVVLELYDPSDLQKTHRIKVWLKTKSFLPR